MPSTDGTSSMFVGRSKSTKALIRILTCFYPVIRQGVAEILCTCLNQICLFRGLERSGEPRGVNRGGGGNLSSRMGGA